MTLHDKMECPECGGRGWRRWFLFRRICWLCKGTGSIPIPAPHGPRNTVPVPDKPEPSGPREL